MLQLLLCAFVCRVLLLTGSVRFFVCVYIVVVCSCVGLRGRQHAKNKTDTEKGVPLDVYIYC